MQIGPIVRMLLALQRLPPLPVPNRAGVTPVGTVVGPSPGSGGLGASERVELQPLPYRAGDAVSEEDAQLMRVQLDVS